MKFTQTSCFAMLLTAGMFSCSKEQKNASERPPEKQSVSDQKRDMAGSDTTRAGRYFAQAGQFVKASKYDSALAYFIKSSMEYEAGQDWKNYTHCYNRMGFIAQQKGDFEPALKYLNHALETGQKQLGQQHDEVASSYSNMGIVYEAQGDFARAAVFYDRALAISLALHGEQHNTVADILGNKGVLGIKSGDYDQAFNFMQKSLSIRLATVGEKHPDVIKNYSNLSIAYAVKGDYERALEYMQKTLKSALAAFGGQDPFVASIYTNIANVKVFQGDYDDANLYYDKALSIRRSIFGEQHPAVADAYENIGGNFYKKGDIARALVFYEKTLPIRLAVLGEKHPILINTYHNLGLVYSGKAEHDREMDFYQKALTLARSTVGEQNINVAGIYSDIGKVYLAKRDYDRAIAFHQKDLAIRRQVLGEHHPETARVYNYIAKVYKDKGRLAQALDAYQRAIGANLPADTNHDPYTNPLLKEILSEDELLKSLQGKAETFANFYRNQSGQLRDLEASVSTFRLTSELIDKMRNDFKAEGSKLFLAERVTQSYDQAIAAALQLSKIIGDRQNLETAFMFAEKSKTGIMLEALSEAAARQFVGIPDSLLEQERQLRVDLAFYDKSLIEAKLQGVGGDSAKMALWEDKFFALKQSYDGLLQRFEAEHPDYFNLKYQGKTVSVPELQQQLLDDKTALVEYFTGKDSIFIFAITKDNFIVKTSAKDSLFERQIEQMRQGITQQDFDKYTRVAYRLYQTLLSPVADKLNGKNLIIIPDGVLSAIPFEALLTKQVAGGKLQEYNQLPYLVNEHTISYAYSATLLQQEQSRKNRQTKRDYLALAPIFAEGVRVGTRGADFFAKNFGRDSSQTLTRMREGYLPDTKREVTGILNRFENSYGFFERWFGNKSRVYLEREANETRLKSKDLGEYRFLHFATHGLINEKNPKLSGLLLAQEDSTSKEDGILHLGEIYNLNLNADLVVLSACETGLGQVAKGEGIIGLTRGFLYAGASNLLVSLWQVSDVTTADLMVDFYDRMLQGATRPVALAEAKRRLILSGSERAKPDYWAPFILIGR